MYKFTEKYLCSILSIEKINYEKTTKRKVIIALLYSGTLFSFLLHLLVFGGETYFLFFNDGANTEATYLVVVNYIEVVVEVFVSLLLTALVPNMFRSYLHIKDESARNKLAFLEEQKKIRTRVFINES
ncbi:hypothetical protein BCT46_03270 [Vibrio sp. 10N.261.46.E8]|nr:hypothetical protein BH584_13455 [Vibrio sp. 10N.261.45.E1]PMJ33130.1 hypothetical protein BCU27_25140 [Vibrio sp. 10N.286.45.B6]PML86379.1 hypothetical protein BCT66_14405 [Vibrio sp. 10N.261.49.E11]PMM77495.1 hypothetical protein BCT48_23845 [Vibrio sp. 10N.261.46.F12]PMM90603.1 hypothetical protein BCT46_03270 [Vibrio sp. 10N.261.46.E8]PMN78816.1 hypothetical protein BCT25_17265 [Vibrio sp. 10N.261.45.A6]PMN88741.1 hypothetical protein BCT22_02665 [Vibrio sp. 10N.261.45.A1]